MRYVFSLALVIAAVAACDGGPTEPRTVTDDRGLAVRLASREVRKPANVSMLFQVTTSAGKPVPGLTVEDFTIYENDEPISRFEAARAIVPKPGKFVSRAVLVLDLSGSVLNAGSLPALKDAARSFITATLPASGGSDADAGIWWFDGAAELHQLSGFSNNRTALLAAIDKIAPGLSKDVSTNLNGAVINAVALAADKSAEDKRRGLISSNAVVIFTDGTDRAARRTDQEALNAVAKNKADVSVYTIGLGSEIRESSLRAIGIDGFVSARGVTELSGAFSAVGASIRAEANSYYLLEYCSPKRAGTNTVKVEVAREALSGSLATTFSAAGFGGGCTVPAS
ncbi:MAG: VWA domain-containing protein [Gemmatimonadetes bacterium]|nr:VWA domain-containing protein [Gemmatimonadota bacterium]